jgi:hypothetical protein
MKAYLIPHVLYEHHANRVSLQLPLLIDKFAAREVVPVLKATNGALLARLAAHHGVQRPAQFISFEPVKDDGDIDEVSAAAPRDLNQAFKQLAVKMICEWKPPPTPTEIRSGLLFTSDKFFPDLWKQLRGTICGSLSAKVEKAAMPAVSSAYVAAFRRLYNLSTADLPSSNSPVLSKEGLLALVWDFVGLGIYWTSTGPFRPPRCFQNIYARRGDTSITHPVCLIL